MYDEIIGKQTMFKLFVFNGIALAVAAKNWHQSAGHSHLMHLAAVQPVSIAAIVLSLLLLTIVAIVTCYNEKRAALNSRREYQTT